MPWFELTKPGPLPILKARRIPACSPTPTHPPIFVGVHPTPPTPNHSLTRLYRTQYQGVTRQHVYASQSLSVEHRIV